MGTLTAFFADPNVIYLVLVFGMWVAVTAAYIPGTGLIELLAVLALCVAIVLMSSLPINWWAVLLLVSGMLSFLLIPFLNDRLAQLAQGGLILQALGGALLFYDRQVSWLLIALTIGVALLYHHYALLPLLVKARGQKAVIDDNGQLVGAFGRVVKSFDAVGSGYIGTINTRGEQWTAYSEKPLQAGDMVVVMEREGLQLFVEGVKPKQLPQNHREEEIL